MLHKDRHWSITDVDTIDELASKLTEQSWTMCTGFRHEGFVFLNDATGPDGAQEYAVVREADSVQVESWTCSWMERERCAEMVRQVIASGGDPGLASSVELRPHPPGSCWACH